MKQLQLFSVPEPPAKSSLDSWEIDQKDYENQTKISGIPQPLNEPYKLQKNDEEITRGYKQCLDTSISFLELEDLPKQQSNLGEYRQLNLWKSIPTHSSSSNTTSQESQSTQTSETINQKRESLTSLQWDSPARERVAQEVEQDYLTQHHHSGEKVSEYCSKLNPSSVLWNNLKELSDEDLELFLPPYIWQDTVSRLKQSRRESLAQDTRDSDCLSFPTLTSNESSTSRPAGQTKCEKWFKDNGLIAPGYQLSAEAMALIMGFPTDWFSPLCQPTPQDASEPDTSQEEQLPQDKLQLPSAESSISTQLLGGDENSPLQKDKKRSSLSRDISIPCLVKQPDRPELKGLIREERGDRFLVEVSDRTISVSKLFVYPDLAKSDGQIDKIPPSKEISPPSKIPPSKTRRKKGEGTGYIYRRTITRRGKQYQEFYYRYRDESGKLRAKYIPQKLLDRILQAESQSLSVADVLKLLGVNEISRGEQFSTSGDEKVLDGVRHNQLISLSRGEQVNTPSTKRRKYGDGGGYIECKPITKNGLEYKQYWFHWQVWRDGETAIKKSRYIPKRLVPKVERMNDEKVAVRKILEVLGVKE